MVLISDGSVAHLQWKTCILRKSDLTTNVNVYKCLKKLHNLLHTQASFSKLHLVNMLYRLVFGCNHRYIHTSMVVTLPARRFKPNVGILLIIHLGPYYVQVDNDSLVLQGIPGTSIQVQAFKLQLANIQARGERFFWNKAFLDIRK